MKAILSAAFAAAFLMSGTVLADEARLDDPNKPIELTSAQMDAVTAGVGANNVAFQPWEALLAVGFSLNHNPPSDASPMFDGVTTGVAVPSAVPHSICFAFCP